MREPYIGQPVTRILVDRSRRAPADATLLGHLDRLVDLGMNYNMIARTAGVTSTTVRYLHDRTAGGCTASVRNALLEVTPRPSKHQALVLSYAARRRLDGLAVMGWSTPVLAEKLRVDRSWFNKVVRRTSSINWNSHVAVADLYAELELKDGGNARTKAWAKRQGFVHPMLWDDIDDYDESPSVPKLSSRAAFWDEYEHFRGFGWDDRRIAEALGMQLETFQARVRRNQGVAA